MVLLSVVVSVAPGPVPSLPDDVGDDVTSRGKLAAQLGVQAAVQKAECSWWRCLTDSSSDYPLTSANVYLVVISVIVPVPVISVVPATNSVQSSNISPANLS